MDFAERFLIKVIDGTVVVNGIEYKNVIYKKSFLIRKTFKTELEKIKKEHKKHEIIAQEKLRGEWINSRLR